MNAQNPSPGAAKKPSKRRGIVIVSVLIVVILLSLAGYHYSDMTLAEARASENSHRLLQARAFAESGVHVAAAMLADPNTFENTLGSNPWNNEVFKDIPLKASSDHASEPLGRVTIIAPPDPSDPSGQPRYGVTCEAGKLNLNALMKYDTANDKKGEHAFQALMKLPGMTDEIANSIIDWIDGDDETRAGGAENDYYAGLSPSYRAKNGPLDSIDELLLVKGVTRELLYGSDLNRNGFKDDNEGGDSFNRGWAAFLTVHSREQNRDQENRPFIFLNNPDLEQLYTALSTDVDDDLAKFVVLCRQRASAAVNPSKAPVNVASLGEYQVKFNRKARNSFSSVFDLVDIQVNVGSSKSPKYYLSPLNDPARQKELLPALLKYATLDDPVEKTEIIPRINVNTAPREVLLTLPGLTEADVDNIIAVRSSLDAEAMQTPAWLLTEAKLPVLTLRDLDPLITTRSQVYRVQAIGSFVGKGPSFRIEAVVDTNSGRPRILEWRDLTELGKGFAPPVP
jgi:type II secretory pathway component PulK